MSGSEMFAQRAITFPPLGNPWILGLASGELLRAAQLEKLRGVVADADWSEELPETILQWCHSVSSANAQYFRFELEGVLEEGEPLLVEWADNADAGDFGLGVSAAHSTRKLVSILVLDGEGTFEAVQSRRTVTVSPGMFLTFPAYARVRRVDAGEVMTVLAGHAVGPAFT